MRCSPPPSDRIILAASAVLVLACAAKADEIPHHPPRVEAELGRLDREAASASPLVSITYFVSHELWPNLRTIEQALVMIQQQASADAVRRGCRFAKGALSTLQEGIPRALEHLENSQEVFRIESEPRKFVRELRKQLETGLENSPDTAEYPLLTKRSREQTLIVRDFLRILDEMERQQPGRREELTPLIKMNEWMTATLRMQASQIGVLDSMVSGACSHGVVNQAAVDQFVKDTEKTTSLIAAGYFSRNFAADFAGYLEDKEGSRRMSVAASDRGSEDETLVFTWEEPMKGRPHAEVLGRARLHALAQVRTLVTGMIAGCTSYSVSPGTPRVSIDENRDLLIFEFAVRRSHVLSFVERCAETS